LLLLVLFAMGNAAEGVSLFPRQRVSATEQVPVSFATPVASKLSAAFAASRQSAIPPLSNGPDVWSNGGVTTAGGFDEAVIVQCAGRDDSRALAAAVTAAKGQWVVIANGQNCAVGDITIPNLRIEKGGLLKPLTSHTVALTGGFDAGTYQIFTNALSGEGTVSFSNNTSIKEVVPQWWGGNPDGVTANQSFISAALNCGAKRVLLTAGDWKISAPISWQAIFVTLTGASRLNTYISAGAGVPAMIKFQGGSGPAGGYVIENIRFNGFSGSNFNGYAIDASVNTFIDSVVRNCWFGLSVAAQGAFNGKAVTSTFDGNTFELGRNSLHFSLASLTHISNNVFYECYYNVIDLDGAIPGYINAVNVDSNIIFSHHNGDGIHVKNASNVNIAGLTYIPIDYIPATDLVYSFPTVLDLDNAEVIASNIKVGGLIAYLDTDTRHVGTAYMKIKHGVKMNNSTLKISNSFFSLTQDGIYIPAGTVDLRADGLAFDQQAQDGISMKSVTGSVNLNNIKISKPKAMWINQTGPTSVDITIQNSQFYDAQWSGNASSGFVFTTTGNFLFAANTVARTSATSALSSFFDLTLSDGKAFVDGNIFIAATPLSGAEIKTGSTGYRLGKNFGTTGRY